VLLWVAGCTRGEPRVLIRGLPGEYPEVVYFVPTAVQAVALTIDDGPDAKTTGKILDVLAAHEVHATFFVVTDNLAGNEVAVRRMLAEGHELGHHMTVDEVSVRLPEAEFVAKFDEADAQIDRLGGTQWFRPGSGRYNSAMRAHALGAGYRIAMASSPPVDTLVRRPAWVSSFYLHMVESGSVIVLHDVGERGARTAETLELLLPELHARGYDVMTLSELDETADR
jgi:peptidoglycan/xylan/chitin deacetylase (PgdA/CDA1 family)